MTLPQFSVGMYITAYYLDQKSFTHQYNCQLFKYDYGYIAWFLEEIKCFVELTEKLWLFFRLIL